MSVSSRQAVLTLDVDRLPLYHQIHSLPPPKLSTDPIYEHALPRFFEMLKETGLSATLFCIGQDASKLERHAQALHAGQHEVASHSHHHHYDLFERSASACREDLEAAHNALSPFAPEGRVRGFRAPGYNVSPNLLGAVQALGYYDSSLFPAPTYYLARRAVQLGHRWWGPPSHSRPGNLRQFWGPQTPYRTTKAKPWKAHAGGTLMEYPIAAPSWLRFPWMGTSHNLLPQPILKWVWSSAKKLPVLVFEMHAIDFLDAHDPGIDPELPKRQRDLSVGWQEKKTRFLQLFQALRASHEVLPLWKLDARMKA